MNDKPKIRTITPVAKPEIRRLERPPIRRIAEVEGNTLDHVKPGIQTLDEGQIIEVPRTPITEEMLDVEVVPYDPTTSPGIESGVRTVRDVLRRFSRERDL